MGKTNALLLIDFYKACHDKMLPDGMEKSVSYYTPRMSRVKRWDKVVNFGLQAFIKTWLIDYFNDNFFNRPTNEVVQEYRRIMDNCFGVGNYNYEKVSKLHKLGYLPIEIISLPEGVMVPMRCPIFGITNTHKDFAWLPQALESLISAEIWYPMICATVGKTYRDIVNKYYHDTCEDNVPRRKALGNFDFRGDKGYDAALKAGSGWCLSFVNSATVPIIPYLEEMYNCDCTKDEVAFGAVSTEHFVMCSNYAVDGDEKTLIKKLLTEIYPNSSFSCVCDSYDYWNVVDHIIPSLKKEILNHNGCMLVRGDSGDCIEVVTKTVFKLWDIFGGSLNSKGYKVLDPHIKAIYGDSITVQRCEEIYKILKDNGFAACNVALGIGSFSMQCIEEDGILKPFTRDTFSSCIKACDATINGKEYPIFKDPKTDRETGNGFKKSQRGCCRVYYDNNGEMTYEDGLTYEESLKDNLMEVIYRDGNLIKNESLKDIRNRLHNNQF